MALGSYCGFGYILTFKFNQKPDKVRSPACRKCTAVRLVYLSWYDS